MRLLKTELFGFSGFLKRASSYMKSKTIEKWVKLLAYIYYHPKCEIPAAYRKLQLKERGTYNTIDKWIEEGIVNKVKKERIIMGTPKELISLTPEGVALFFRLKEALNDEVKNNT